MSTKPIHVRACEEVLKATGPTTSNTIFFLPRYKSWTVCWHEATN